MCSSVWTSEVDKRALYDRRATARGCYTQRMVEGSKPPHVFIMTGEASGDLHAASLVRELRDYVPTVRVSAVGGAHLESVGADLVDRIEEFTAFGLWEPLAKIRELFRTLRRVLRHCDTDRPDLVILVDFPDFNMILARRLRARGVPMVYFISPQIWAWRPGRSKTLAKLVRKMLCFFPWEEPLYHAVGLDCEWVGHPLLDTVRPSQSRRQTRLEFGYDPDEPIIAFLPGSRPFEIAHFVPLYCAAAKRLLARQPDLRFWLALASTISEAQVREHMPADAPPMRLVGGRTYDVVHASDFVVVATGTATLECALLERPMLVVAAVNWLTYRVGMMFTQLPYYALPNHLAGRQIVPEIVQEDTTPEAVAGIVSGFLEDPTLCEAMVSDIRDATANLGTPGAAARAAKAVAAVLVEVGACELAA